MTISRMKSRNEKNMIIYVKRRKKKMNVQLQPHRQIYMNIVIDGTIVNLFLNVSNCQ